MGRGNGQKRRFSAGTKFMLGLLVIVLCGSAVVLGRLSSGATVDLGKLQMNILDLQETFAPETEQRPAATIQAEAGGYSYPGMIAVGTTAIRARNNDPGNISLFNIFVRYSSVLSERTPGMEPPFSRMFFAISVGFSVT